MEESFMTYSSEIIRPVLSQALLFGFSLSTPNKSYCLHMNSESTIAQTPRVSSITWNKLVSYWHFPTVFTSISN